MSDLEDPRKQPDAAGEELYELEEAADAPTDEGPATLYPELAEGADTAPAPGADEPWADVEQPKAVDPAEAARRRDEARKAAAERMAQKAAVKRRVVVIAVGLALAAGAAYYFFFR